MRIQNDVSPRWGSRRRGNPDHGVVLGAGLLYDSTSSLEPEPGGVPA